jgi:2-phosphosulfolactate phosphatase
MKGTFAIDYLPESATRYVAEYSIAAIDVIRATTLAATAVAAGHPCYFAVSVEEARAIAGTLTNPLLAGELDGDMPPGFHMNNSPAQLLLEQDRRRPIVMLSSSGTKLLRNASACGHVYIACLRNFAAVAQHMIERHDRIAVNGAGSRGEFREEDQLCCAWIGRELLAAGYRPENASTERLIELFGDVGPSVCTMGASAAYLERTAQLADLDFILSHVNDLRSVFKLEGRQVVSLGQARQRILTGYIPAAPYNAVS